MAPIGHFSAFCTCWPGNVFLLECSCVFILSSVGKVVGVFFFVMLITRLFSLTCRELIKILTIAASNGKSSDKASVILLPVRFQVCHY